MDCLGPDNFSRLQMKGHDSDFYYYALFTKYNKINIYRIYMEYKRKRLNNT